MRDTGILPPDAVARRLNRELFLVLGGSAALLMQIAHPLVAAGVAEHSDFRTDPLGRLHRTLNTSLAAVFGDTAVARRAIARIDERHETVRGRAADGRRYSARDPQLLLWVQVTLVLTCLRLYELVLGRLTDADRQRFWDEGKIYAGALGVREELVPASFADLQRYEREMLASVVRPDATSRQVALGILRPFPWLPTAAYWPLDTLTAGLLPPSLRDAFDLRWGPVERFAFRFWIVALRALRRALPDALVIVPHARAYERRAG